MLVVEVIGSEDKRLRPVCSPVRPATVFPGRGDEVPESLKTAVFADALRDINGRAEAFNGVPLPLPSCRGMGESRRSDEAEAVRGSGDGADEPLAAAVALRT